MIGIGGASAAVMLAMRGHEVTLLEDAPQVCLSLRISRSIRNILTPEMVAGGSRGWYSSLAEYAEVIL